MRAASRSKRALVYQVSGPPLATAVALVSQAPEARYARIEPLERERVG
jgi:hypothetical protein